MADLPANRSFTEAMSEHLLCIGGPAVGQHIQVPHGTPAVRWCAPPKLRFVVSSDNRAVKYRVHTYFVQTLNGKRYLVHDSIKSNWIEYVIGRYAKRHKRR